MNSAAGETYQDRVRYYRRKAEEERSEKKRARWFRNDVDSEDTVIDFEEAIYNFKHSSGFDKMYKKAKRHAKGHAIDHLAFYRDDEQGYIGGVCAGIADKMNWSVTTVRVITVISGMVLTLPTVLAYVAGTVFLRKKHLAFHGRNERNFWKSASRNTSDTTDVDADFTGKEKV